jgi:uncharacterized membrane protein
MEVADRLDKWRAGSSGRLARKMKSLVLQLSLTACFAALYAVAVILLAPISYSLIQVRLADALIPLSMIYGLPVVYGVTIGNIVANMYGGYGPIDVMFGTVANLLGSYVAFRLRTRPFSACFAATLVVSLIVGGYLWLLLNVPVEFSLLSLFAGSFISITIIGYLLQRLLSSRSK